MRRVISAICNKHGYHEGAFCKKCDTENFQDVFYTPKDKLYEFVDVHTTGKPVEITSKRQWEKHLKEHGKYQLSAGDIKKLTEPNTERKSDYREIAEKAWRERNKFVMDVKYKRRRINYGQ